MAYDENLAQRIREALADNGAVAERTMFGGVAFLLRGLMFVGVSGSSLMASVGKKDYADTLASDSRPHDRSQSGRLGQRPRARSATCDVCLRACRWNKARLDRKSGLG